LRFGCHLQKTTSAILKRTSAHYCSKGNARHANSVSVDERAYWCYRPSAVIDPTRWIVLKLPLKPQVKMAFLRLNDERGGAINMARSTRSLLLLAVIAASQIVSGCYPRPHEYTSSPEVSGVLLRGGVPVNGAPVMIAHTRGDDGNYCRDGRVAAVTIARHSG
jgi:hypothetical protein